MKNSIIKNQMDEVYHIEKIKNSNNLGNITNDLLHINHSFVIDDKKNKNKINHLIQLIRPNNIVPTGLLFFTSGFIINPSIKNLLQNPSFIVSMIDTILIMSYSMVINDLFDVQVDKINNPNRPFVNGDVKIWEGLLFSIILLSITELLNLFFLPQNIQTIIHLATFITTIYTPILKKVLFIKNITCATLVSFSVFLAGLSSTNKYLALNKNFDLFSIMISIVFFGSLYNELLLDMRDMRGDQKNNIITIPVLVGNNISWIFANIILYFNIIYHSLELLYLYNCYIGTIIPILFSPISYSLIHIKKENYSKDIIKRALKKTNISLFLLLLFFGMFSYYRIF
jgi:geranylgeranylglycerol-phosphate geranylgeranyltransferase